MLLPSLLSPWDLLGVSLIKLALAFYGCSHQCFGFAMMDVAMTKIEEQRRRREELLLDLHNYCRRDVIFIVRSPQVMMPKNSATRSFLCLRN